MYRPLSLVLVVLLLLSGCTINETPVTEEIYVTTRVKEEALSSTDDEAFVQEEEAVPGIKESYYDEHGVWYEIFVRSFADGNGDGVGDFVGMTKQLDYLNDGQDGGSDLGIDGVWLMPINPSPSYHGYDVTDYYDVNPEYGTMEEFEQFLAAADERGIDVIMDLVVNHSSAQHPWFVNASSSSQSDFRDYYTFVGPDDEGYNLDKQVWGHRVFNKVGGAYYYAIFWDQMPDLNFENQAVRSEVIDIAKFWLDKGVDGFRMDAAMHIYGSGESPKGTNPKDKNIQWWKEFDAEVRVDYPDYYLVGEVWADTKSRADYASAFDTTFNFDLAEFNMVEMVKYGMDLGQKNNGLGLAVEGQLETFDAVREGFIDAIYLSNHDQKRVMTALKGDMDKMKQLASIYLTLPGNPFIYYGEEIGMTGDKPDEQIREPFIWGDDTIQTSWESLQYNSETVSVVDQIEDEASLFNHYRTLIDLRKSNSALLEGDFQVIETESNRLIAYRRSHEGVSVVAIHNISDGTLEFNTDAYASVLATVIYGEANQSDGAISIAAGQSFVYIEE